MRNPLTPLGTIFVLLLALALSMIFFETLARATEANYQYELAKVRYTG